MQQPLKISAIIPTLNEQSTIRRAIESANRAGCDEIIVVDGGSADGTAVIASGDSCTVIESSPGRAKQMNRGAQQATGDVLLFLHADNWFESEVRSQILEALADPNVLAGAFRQQIEAEEAIYRWLEWGNAFRVDRFSVAYGDQGIFVRRSVFEQVGGFAEEPLLEDLLLSRRLKKEGKLVLLPGPLHVSARRWQANGVLRQTLRNWTILAAHRCGVSPGRLSRYYRIRD